MLGKLALAFFCALMLGSVPVLITLIATNGNNGLACAVFFGFWIFFYIFTPENDQTGG